MTTWHCERRSQESGKENVLEVRESLQVSKLTEMLTCFGKDDDVPIRSLDFLFSVFFESFRCCFVVGFLLVCFLACFCCVCALCSFSVVWFCFVFVFLCLPFCLC